VVHVDSTERFRAALRLEPTDRVPVFLMGGAWAAKLSGLPRERLLRDPVALAEAQRHAHGLVGQDALLAYFDPVFIPEAYGCELRLLESGPLVTAVPLSTAMSRSPGVDEGRLPVILAATEMLARYGAGRVSVGTLVEGPLTTLSRVAGTEAVLRMTVRETATLEAGLDSITTVLSRFTQAAGRAGADFLVVADPVGSTQMISPSTYRRLAFPALRRLIHETPVPVVLHVCGDTSLILDLMAETGAAAVSLDQCMDLRVARGRVGETCALAGNVDPLTLLTGSPDDVACETAEVIAAGGRRGHIVMPGCGVPPGAPVENVVAMVEAARQA
jgi:MtaA/CmuA family methyltransferase